MPLAKIKARYPVKLYSEAHVERVADHEWKQGFACAVAVILRTHGDEVIAKDVLRCGGDALKHADTEDIETFKKHGLLPRY